MDFVRDARAVAMRLVGGRGHYDVVVKAVLEAERSVWITTANLKELMVEDTRARPGRRRTLRRGRPAGEYRSVLAVFGELVGRGVEIRILHAGPPSRPFREELRRQPALNPRGGAGLVGRAGAVPGSFELRACPRVHLKVVIIDGALAYLGSANWTGAGLGAKGEGRRNFELGLVSRDDLLLDELQGHYQHLWQGGGCAGCRLRAECPGPLDQRAAAPVTPRPPAVTVTRG